MTDSEERRSGGPAAGAERALPSWSSRRPAHSARAQRTPPPAAAPVEAAAATAGAAPATTRTRFEFDDEATGTHQRLRTRRRKRWLIVPVLLAIAGAAVYIIVSTPNPGAARSASGTPASGTSAGASSAPVTTVASAVSADTTTAPTTSSTVTTSTTVAGAPAAPIRSALYQDGKLYLRGRVPSQAAAQQIISAVAPVFGPGNVIDQYTIVPGTPVHVGAPVQIGDTVTFPTGSAAIDPHFASLLQLGVSFLKLNPQATMDVIGYTDNTGTDSANMALSHARVNAVISYFESAGISASRLEGIAKGDVDPVADNSTAAGRQLNRRIEFVINNLLS